MNTNVKIKEKKKNEIKKGKTQYSEQPILVNKKKQERKTYK